MIDYSKFTNEQITDALYNVVAIGWERIPSSDRDKFTDWDIIVNEDKELAHEWYRRLNGACGYSLLGMHDQMSYLISGWMEYSYEWYMYPGCDQIVRNCLEEYHDKMMCSWEESHSCLD